MEDVSWHSEPCIMGIDEAGRGPVLGPMVYACAYCPARLSDYLKNRGLADSKTLTEEKRENLLDQIKAEPNVGYAFDVLTAADISGKMLAREAVSLNVQAAESTYRVIDSVLAKGVNIQEIYVDTVGDADRYKEKLSQRFPGISFTVCPKADALFPIVSAASIVAKVTRDSLLKNYQSIEEGVEISTKYGCGYPGDAVTKEWLEKHTDKVFGFPSLVRFSWGTCEPILKEHSVPVKWESEEGDPGQQMLSFGGQKNAPAMSSGAGRHSFFRARRLQKVVAAF